MTQEEKAKAYDEALKVIKGNLDALNEITETGAETVNIQSIKNCFYKAFPELKESEDGEDEKARKWIYDYISNCPNKSFEFYGGIGKKAVLAWLEKQKDSVSNAKYIEDVAHAFEDGRKKGIEEKQKEQKSKDKSKFKESSEYERIRKDIVALIKFALEDGSAVSPGSHTSKEEALAWLENHNPSFKQISDSVIWDSGLRTGIELGKKQKEPDDAWTEEDEAKVKAMCKEGDLKPSEIEWLKKLKNRIAKQEPKAEWSEEDEEMYARIVLRYTDYEGVIMRTKEESVANKILNAMAQEEIWFKSLKDRGNFPKSNTNSPSEWSEEDEEHLKWLCRIIRSYTLHGGLSLKEESELGKWIDKWINHEPQREKKWSKFDEDCLKRAIWYVENPDPCVMKDTNLVLWLKSLPEIFNLQPNNRE